MKIQELAEKIEEFEPDAEPRDVARLCLLISNEIDVDELSNMDQLIQVWRKTNLKIQAATDQHAAMTEELEHLARNGASSFSQKQIWTLIRAIKVQSQILGLYLGEIPEDN